MANTLNLSENLELFDQFRKEAISVTNQAIEQTQQLMEDPDLLNCGGRVLEKLQYSQHILQDNTLPVSLLASFQKGKSTTTVAMADGHEITPCGKGGGGIRMSAIPVTIYNDATSTVVKVHPYSKQALVGHIIECCASHLEDISTTAYDLDDEESYHKLKTAVKAEIEEYQNDKNYDIEKLAMLRSAILILQYYGCDSYKALLNDEFRTIEDVQPFIAFAGDLESRWKDLRKFGFDIVNQKGADGELLLGELQSLYVFVEDIVIPVHSEFMGETGTAVIDAPGTMASNEDTERALRAANNAAVVLFILDGEQQLSEADKKMLRKLNNAGMAEKVVFVINFRKNPEIIQDEGGIGESILASIQEAGYCAPHQKKLLYYNAFLAVRAAQGNLILNQKIDPLTEEAIFRDAEKRKIKFTTLEEAWKKTTMRVLRAIDAEETADELDELGLCEQTVESIARESNWKNMITALREHVMSNRVSGVLRDLGVQPVANGLKEIEAGLALRENMAQINEQTAKTDYEKAKKLLKKYSEEVDDLIDNNFNSTIDKAFADSYFDDVVLGAVKIAAEEAAPKVFKLTGLVGNVKDIADKVGRFATKATNAVAEYLTGNRPLIEKDPNGIREKCGEIINKEFKDAMTEQAYNWSQKLEDSIEYHDNIKVKVKHVQRKLVKTWEALDLAENELLTNIAPVPDNISGSLSKDAVNTDVRNIITNTTVAVGTGAGAVMKGMLSGAGAYVGAAWVYVYLLPADLIIPGIAEILTVLATAVAAIVYAVASEKKQDKIKQIEKDIVDKMYSMLVSEKSEIRHKIIEGDKSKNPPEPGVSFIREFYVTLFKGVVEQQREELEEAYNDRMKQLKKSSDERAKIAEKAAKWRTETIEPLRKRLDAMLEQINEIWG